MRPALLDPLADPRWAEFASAADGASIFHQPAWLALLRRQYRYPLAAACVVDGDCVVAGLPLAFVASRLTGRRLVSLPFSDTCRPLVAGDAPADALEALAAAVEAERARRGVALEVRAGFPAVGTAVERFVEHLLDLTPGREAVERAISSTARRNARKAERSGVSVERRTDREALDAFYRLHLLTRQRLGVPTQPRSFIRGLEELFAQGLGFVGLATLEGRPAAAAVFLVGGGTLTYKYGASAEEALHARPNNLLFADAIGWGCDQGLRTLDFGRTDLDGEGLRRFKRSWGASEEPLSYTYAGTAPPDAGHSRQEKALAEVIRRSPPLAGRVVGELLYRHVA